MTDAAQKPSSIYLRAYLDAERAMILLDDAGDAARADALRDALDPIWVMLSDDDRNFLNQRKSADPAASAASDIEQIAAWFDDQAAKERDLTYSGQSNDGGVRAQERWMVYKASAMAVRNGEWKKERK